METVHRVKCLLLSQMFRFGVAESRVERDMTLDLRGALQPYRKTLLPALTDPVKAGKLLGSWTDMRVITQRIITVGF